MKIFSSLFHSRDKPKKIQCVVYWIMYKYKDTYAIIYQVFLKKSFAKVNGVPVNKRGTYKYSKKNGLQIYVANKQE